MSNEWPLLFAYVVLWQFVATFVHEAGHALAARWQGFAVTSCGLGWFRPFLVVDFRGTKWYLCSHRPFSGLTLAMHRQLYATPRQRAWMIAGGVLGNLACLIVCLLLAWAWPAARICFAVGAGLNLFMLSNLIPFRVSIGGHAYSSDGAHLWRIWTGRESDQSPVALINFFQGLRDFWTTIGSQANVYLYGMQAAYYWAILGWPERGLALHDELEQLRVAHPDLDVTDGLFPHYATFLRAVIVGEAGQREQAYALLAAAEECFHAAGNAPGALSAAITQASYLVHAGQHAAAAQRAESWRADPTLHKFPELQRADQDLRLEIALATDASDLPAQLKHFETRTPTTPRMLCAIAAHHVRQGDDAAAARVYEKAVQLALGIHAGLGKDDQVTWLERQTGWLAEARACFERRGDSAALARLEGWLDEPARRAQQEESRRRSERSCWRAGLFINGLNALMLFGSLASGYATHAGPIEVRGSGLELVLNLVLTLTHGFPKLWTFWIFILYLWLWGLGVYLVFLPIAWLGRFRLGFWFLLVGCLPVVLFFILGLAVVIAISNN